MPSDLHIRYEAGSLGHNTIYLAGPIGENSGLAQAKSPPLPPNTIITVDLQGLTMLNSIGVRDFSLWARALPTKELHFVHCPKIFVDQLNMIPGFVPNHTSVDSFYVPYSTGLDGGEPVEDIDLLFQFGREYRLDPKGKVVMNYPPPQKDHLGRVLEMDVMPDKYFRFLEVYCPRK